jgi:uncharacterized membrane protein YfcA
MTDSKLLIVSGIFLLAGLVKGMVGLGLPTIAMGLLCLFMQPIEAAAFVVIPNALTNMWQMIAGPAFAALARRLALLLIAVASGTFASIGLLASGRGSIATVLLGLVLMAYALHGLTSTQVQVNPKYEWLASPVVGAVSGLLNGATGVFVVPATPYLASLRMSKDELIQSVGMLAFTAGIALGAALWLSGRYSATDMSWIGLVPAVAGMYIGLRIRHRLNPVLFRRWFLVGLVLLGGYMLLR